MILNNNQNCGVKDKDAIRTSIGGQALLEGIMMRGPELTSYVVRKSDGTLAKKTEPTPSPKKRHPMLGWPLIRGPVNFFLSMQVGVAAIEYSASFIDDGSEEPGKIEKWLMDRLGDSFNKALMGFSVFLGIALSVGLFILLPTVIAGFFTPIVGSGGGPVRSLLEGGLRILIFLSYLYGVSRVPDIKRVFMYHGAEHKTIACYEHKCELTVENVRGYSRLHPRCGTSFLLIVMVVSILVFSLLTWEGVLMRILMRLLLLPLVVGISYELIKLAGRYDNIFTRFISAPGLWLQNITTVEPDDSMIEVAIEAMTDVIPKESGSDQW